MPVVPEEIVESIWREIAASEPTAARRVIERLTQRQPALLAYVMAEVEDARPRVQELAVYLLVVVVRMFESVPGYRLKRASIEQVEHRAADNDADLERLGAAHERFIEQAARIHAEAQPNVLRYLTEAILEGDDPDLDLTADEEGLVFLVLKTAVDVLDQSCKPQS